MSITFLVFAFLSDFAYVRIELAKMSNIFISLHDYWNWKSIFLKERTDRDLVNGPLIALTH